MDMDIDQLLAALHEPDPFPTKRQARRPGMTTEELAAWIPSQCIEVRCDYPELGPCLVWQGGTSGGYGQVGHEGRVKRATHVVYYGAHGEWPPKGKIVRHRCDNPGCCRPDHLELGTQRENAQDAAKRKGKRKDWPRRGKLRLAAINRERRHAAAQLGGPPAGKLAPIFMDVG